MPIARVTEGSSGSGDKAEMFSSVAPIRPQFCSSDLQDDHPPSCGYVQEIRLIAYLDDSLVLAYFLRVMEF